MKLTMDARVKGFNVKPDKEEGTPIVIVALEIDDMARVDIGRLAHFLGQHVTVTLASPQVTFDIREGSLALIDEEGGNA